jgi:hypothetical protein
MCPRYDDGAFCPVCKGRMTYDYRIAAHMGAYHCSACGLKRPEPEIKVTSLNPETGAITLCDGIAARLTFPSLTAAYNLAAAVAATTAAGVSAAAAARALDGYAPKSGRTVSFTIGSRTGLLLISKHENSLSYNQSLAWAAGRGKPCTVVILVDTISRKYYTSETSWLWDIDFDILADDSVQNIVLAGRYVNELAARFAMTALDPGKIGYAADLSNLREHLSRSTMGDIYVLTCFADREKLMDALGVS